MTRVEKRRELVDRAQPVLAPNGDLLKEVLRLGLERLMEAERTRYVSAERHERIDGHRTRPNRYGTGTLRTRAVELELGVPRTRDGEFYPFLLQRSQRPEKALVAALAERVGRLHLEGVGNL